MCRIAFAFVICMLVSVQGQSCSCIGGCDNTTLVFPGSGGRIVDVAYGKTANMNSTYDRSDGKSGPSCMAVDGRTDTEFRTLKNGNPNCVTTDVGDTDVWWAVDLGRNYHVSNITIYNRYNTPRRMSGIHVEVDNQLCFSFPLETVNLTALLALHDKIDVTCTPPLTGRVVRLQKRGQGFNYATGANIINICEVQVWGCADAYVGPDCQCGHCRDGARCDVTTLDCPGGCDRGWGSRFCNQSCPAGTHGYDCREQCGQCADSDTCNTVTGLCPIGCQPGWQGDDCTQACDAGKYGNNCSSSCGHCNTGDVCHHTNGTCPRGCAAGFDPSDRLCKTICQNGRYGESCSEPCGHCSGDEPCNPVNGTCAACQPQFQPPLCQVCIGNRYGASCELNCNTKCDGDGSCEQDTGRCVDGCKAGYRLGESGFCNEVCTKGTFGNKCSRECGKCTDSCRHNDGFCIGGCLDGFEGPLCEHRSESSHNLVGPAAGGVIGGLCVILVALCILVGILIWRSRKRSSSEKASPPQASADQSLRADDSVELSNQVALRAGAPDGLNRQAALQEETGNAVGTEAEESHFYDGLQTPDDSDRATYATPVFKGQQDNARNSHTYQNSALHNSDTGKDYYNL